MWIYIILAGAMTYGLLEPSLKPDGATVEMKVAWQILLLFQVLWLSRVIWKAMYLYSRAYKIGVAVLALLITLSAIFTTGVVPESPLNLPIMVVLAPALLLYLFASVIWFCFAMPLPRWIRYIFKEWFVN